MNLITVKPLNTADLGTGKRAAVFRKRRYWESYITYKTRIWDLKRGSGIGRAAVLGGAVLRGTTVGQLKVIKGRNVKMDLLLKFQDEQDAFGLKPLRSMVKKTITMSDEPIR